MECKRHGVDTVLLTVRPICHCNVYKLVMGSDFTSKSRISVNFHLFLPNIHSHVAILD